MITPRRKEPGAALAKIRDTMQKLTQNDPDWMALFDGPVGGSGEEVPPEMEQVAKDVSDFLQGACDEIIAGNLGETEFLDLFPAGIRPAVRKMTDSRLRVFHAFAPLRTVYGENPSKAEALVDQIWQNYVVRFNPFRKFECPGDATDEDMSALEEVLDSFADFCVVRTLHYEGIFHRIKELSGLSDRLCSYIARRVESDYSELRLNYIVFKLDELKCTQD